MDNSSEFTIKGTGTKDLAKKVKTAKVNIKHEESVNTLRASVVQSMLEIYIKREIGKSKEIPPTLIFCSSIDDKNDPRSLVNIKKRLIGILRKDCGINATKDIMYYQHSKLTPVENRAFPNKNGGYLSPIAAFRDNRFKILLVVATAQEGFDKPNLEVIVDLVPSLDNSKRFTQKNRLTRIHEDKVIPARYYIPDEIKAHIVAKNESYELDTDDKALENLEKTTGLDKIYKNKGITKQDGNKLTQVLQTSAFHQAQQEADEVGSEILNVKLNLKNIEVDETSKDSKTYVVTTGLVVTQAEKKNMLLGNKVVKLKDIISRKGDSIPWADMKATWELIKNKKFMRELGYESV